MVPKSSRETLWLSLIMATVFTSLAVVFIRNNRDPVEQIESISKQIELVHEMRIALAATSEAQNSAVLASKEQDSRMFIDEARLARDKFEALKGELSDRVSKRGLPEEIELAKKVDTLFREFQIIDEQILNLDVQNSNGKAFDLAFGPALKLLKDLDDSLDLVIVEHNRTSGGQNYELLRLVCDARVRLLRIQILLPPHIAEGSEQEMDSMEEKIASEENGFRGDLMSMKDLLAGDELGKIGLISSRYAEFLATKAEILKLSRENTVLRSVSIALNERRVAMLACQDALAAIEKAIRNENIASMIPSGRGQ